MNSFSLIKNPKAPAEASVPFVWRINICRIHSAKPVYQSKVFEGHVFFLGKIKLMNIFFKIKNQKAPAEAGVPFVLGINTLESTQ